MMKIVIVRYNAGNTQSVMFALQRLGVNAVLSDNCDIIASADKIIFPGVGEASVAMEYLTRTGIDKVLRKATQPVLGICLGLQLFFDYSEEGNTNCLGIIPGKVGRFKSIDTEQKVPHMGWNNIVNTSSPLFSGIEGEQVYFVHSYYAPLSEHTIATTDYIVPFSASARLNNFYAVQFHPEKSGDVGSAILQNFLYKC